MLVIKIRFDEEKEGGTGFDTHFLTTFTRECIEKVMAGPPLLELSIVSAPDLYQVKVEKPEKIPSGR